MALPGRKFSSGGEYRFGFNGKENDDEINEGVENFGGRIYDNRIGKFLSLDPEYKSFPQHSNYSFAANMPICAIDIDGKRVYIIVSNGEYNNAVDQRKQEIETMKGFDPKRDHVYVVQVTELSELKGMIKNVVNDAMGNNYGSTVEFDWYGHGGPGNGPIAGPYKGPYKVSDDPGQMNHEGWAEIDFNFDPECSSANFYGCRMSEFAQRFLSYQRAQYASGYGGQSGDTHNPNTHEDTPFSASGEFLWDGDGLFIFQNPGFEAHRLKIFAPDNTSEIPNEIRYITGSNDDDWLNHNSELRGKTISEGNFSTNITVNKDPKDKKKNIITGYKKK